MGRHEGKTEQATPGKRRKARREGTVARSQEIGMAASLAGAALAVRVFAPTGFTVLREETAGLFRSAADGVPLEAVGASAVRMSLAFLVPLLAVAVVVALVAGFSQTGMRAAPAAAKPKLSHLSPKKGLQRLAPAKAGWELVRTMLKLGVLVAALWGPVQGWTTSIGRGRGLDAGLAFVLGQTWAVLIRVILLAAVVAALDYFWNRRTTNKELKMTKAEVKQEFKNDEGDPFVKGQRRRRHSELSRNRMLSEVAHADVVITNPTHLAVALVYRDGDAAPKVVAKGADRIAAKIRREAARHGVLIREDKPLARALYRRCKVGTYVPGALYEAVAIVLALAYRRRGRRAA